MNAKRFLKTAGMLWLFLLLAWVAGCAGNPADIGPSAPIPVTVLFFNDLHGYLMPFEIKSEDGRQEVGGIARMATLIHEIREENSRRQAHTLVLVAGDILQGTPMSTVFRGLPDIECLNAMGVDALTVGNHEFDFGLDNFHRLRNQANFPFLSANIVEKEGNRQLCQSFLTISLRDDLAVTIVGVTTGELLTTTLASNVATLAVIDPVTAVLQIHEQNRFSGPVLLLSHNRHPIDREIATVLPELAAIIGGHEHLLLSPCLQVGNVPIFQAFEKGRYLGRVDLQIDPVSHKAVLVDYAYIPVTDRIAPDPEVAAIVAAYSGQMDSRFREVIGHASTFLNGERKQIRYAETALGNFVADIMVDYTGAQIALINSGAIRASIKQGPVTVEDIFKTIPFANELMVTELTGTEIMQALHRSVSRSQEDQDGGFLQVSGLTFQVRERSAVNVRTGQSRQPLQPETVYTVAITDFLATGGDSYTVFTNRPVVKTGLPLRELVVDTIRRRGVITAVEDGRIRRLE